MTNDKYSPVAFNPDVELSARDCYNCLIAFIDGDPELAACTMFEDGKPLRVQTAEEHCPFRYWELEEADTETLQAVIDFDEYARANWFGYNGQIKDIDKIRGILSRRVSP